MPLYEYECHHCRKVFTTALSLREHERHNVLCPACRSKDVGQLISTFIAKTAGKT